MKRIILPFIYSFWVRWFLKLIIGIRFKVASFLKKEEQFIIVANHNSHLDTMTLLASIPASILHRVKPVAALDHFGKTKMQERMSNYFINTLLIQRKRDKENPEKDPINQIIKALDEGYSLILFPEGTRGKPEEEQALKPGIGLVLRERPNVKYVPAYMLGMGKALPKGTSLILPYTCQLEYGEATSIDAPDVGVILDQIQTDFTKMKTDMATRLLPKKEEEEEE